MRLRQALRRASAHRQWFCREAVRHGLAPANGFQSFFIPLMLTAAGFVPADGQTPTHGAQCIEGVKDRKLDIGNCSLRIYAYKAEKKQSARGQD